MGLKDDENPPILLLFPIEVVVDLKPPSRDMEGPDEAKPIYWLELKAESGKISKVMAGVLPEAKVLLLEPKLAEG